LYTVYFTLKSFAHAHMTDKHVHCSTVSITQTKTLSARVKTDQAGDEAFKGEGEGWRMDMT